jgi:o-succinylbenzoate synthase
MVTVTGITFTDTELPLITPLLTARGETSSRRILLVTLNSESLYGIGEAAPLPEYGTEPFDVAFEVITRLSSRHDFPPSARGLGSFERWLKGIGVSREFAPATAWALECAMLSLLAQSRQMQIAPLLSSSPLTRIPVSRVISGKTTGEILWAAERAAKLGYDTVKIKLGRHTVVQDIDTIRRLRARLGDRLEIRVDANEEWSLEHAWEFCRGVQECQLEYVEDPLREPTADKLLMLKAATPVPVALDRMANTVEGFEEILAHRLCRVVVLKPAVIGSFALIKRMVRRARARRISVVFSNVIESSVGLGYGAACAAAWGSRRYAHGLATASLLAQDTVKRPLTPLRGMIRLSDLRMLTA